MTGHQPAGGVDCQALTATAYDMVLSSDALDDLMCACYEGAPCDPCRFQAAFTQMKTVLLAAACPPADDETGDAG